MNIKQLYQCFIESKGISTDTRKDLKGTLFFALKGDNFNGNLFAAKALEQGANYVVADELADVSLVEKFGERFILVPDTLKTLQELAAYHRQQFNCPVLAITGSNGKTTTKELIAAVLSQKFKTYYTPGNWNNHFGIPQTLLSVGKDAEFIVIEMGANHQGEIASYCEYVQPDFGLITNVGMAHTEGFGGFDGVVKGKTELYQDIAARQGKLFVCTDHAILMDKSSMVKDRIFYGLAPKADCRGHIEKSEGEMLSVYYETKQTLIQTQLVGDYNFENVMSAICIGQYFGVEIEKIKDAIESYIPSSNRSQKISYGSNTVILDAYNANPSSMNEALKNFEKIQAPNKMVILGQMMELGIYSDEEHRKIAKTVEAMPFSKKVFVGEGFSFLKNNTSVVYFENSGELKIWFQQQDLKQHYILVKGSRKNKLEEILTQTNLV
ncbi:MAG: UDP-N-acetylmuramoyl-tripeptide--D-alanyl-D-alanine ligase [Bacteroidetes bacterium]|nr:UDP-N-acetylmuramoyl-tripeptide--D-alanyl-D-alanine ligase [Bacteroidota bacterium]